VFACVREMITMEVERIGDLEESEDRTFWRRLVLTAYREAGCAGNEALPEATCNDLEEWTVLLDGLSDRVFWDDDYALGHYFLDPNPDARRATMEQLQIVENYYLAVAPDPGEQELKQIRNTLREITGKPERQEPALIPGLQDSYHGLLVGPCTAD